MPPRSFLPLWLPQGSRGVYVRAEHRSLPSCASNMLTVRIGQLTVEDFHLIRLAALSAAPGPDCAIVVFGSAGHKGAISIFGSGGRT